MNSGSRPCAPRYFEDVESTDEPPWRAAPAEIAAWPEPGMRELAAGVGARKLGDHALHRPAGGELHHHERYQHDAEQRRDHEQQTANDIGGHELIFA